MDALVRGGGAVASAVAVVLHRAGYGVAIHEIAAPSAPRRGMAFADAVFDGSKERGGLRPPPVAPAPRELLRDALAPGAAADAGTRKRAAPEPQLHLAPLTIGLGP